MPDSNGVDNNHKCPAIIHYSVTGQNGLEIIYADFNSTQKYWSQTVCQTSLINNCKVSMSGSCPRISSKHMYHFLLCAKANLKLCIVANEELKACNDLYQINSSIELARSGFTLTTSTTTSSTTTATTTTTTTTTTYSNSKLPQEIFSAKTQMHTESHTTRVLYKHSAGQTCITCPVTQKGK